MTVEEYRKHWQHIDRELARQLSNSFDSKDDAWAYREAYELLQKLLSDVMNVLEEKETKE